jgi:hypothetical protein
MSLARNPGSLAEDTPRLTTTVDLREGSVEELEGEYAPDAVRTMNVNLGSDMLDAVHSGRPMSRAESICDLIIKSDRVFLYGKCWRCTEAFPTPDSDLGLCGACLHQLRDTV